MLKVVSLSLEIIRRRIHFSQTDRAGKSGPFISGGRTVLVFKLVVKTRKVKMFSNWCPQHCGPLPGICMCLLRVPTLGAGGNIDRECISIIKLSSLDNTNIKRAESQTAVRRSEQISSISVKENYRESQRDREIISLIPSNICIGQEMVIIREDHTCTAVTRLAQHSTHSSLVIYIFQTFPIIYLLK